MTRCFGFWGNDPSECGNDKEIHDRHEFDLKEVRARALAQSRAEAAKRVEELKEILNIAHQRHKEGMKDPAYRRDYYAFRERIAASEAKEQRFRDNPYSKEFNQ